MTADGALNLLWLLVAAGALAAFALAEWRRRQSIAHRAPFRRGVALLVALIAVFPTVSATDDLVRLAPLEVGLSAPKQFHVPAARNPAERSALFLARLSEVFQNSRVSTPVTFGVACRFVSIAGLPLVFRHDCSLPSPASRAPPAVVLPS